MDKSESNPCHSPDPANVMESAEVKSWVDKYCCCCSIRPATFVIAAFSMIASLAALSELKQLHCTPAVPSAVVGGFVGVHLVFLVASLLVTGLDQGRRALIKPWLFLQGFKLLFLLVFATIILFIFTDLPGKMAAAESAAHQFVSPNGNASSDPTPALDPPKNASVVVEDGPFGHVVEEMPGGDMTDGSRGELPTAADYATTTSPSATPAGWDHTVNSVGHDGSEHKTEVPTSADGGIRHKRSNAGHAADPHSEKLPAGCANGMWGTKPDRGTAAVDPHDQDPWKTTAKRLVTAGWSLLAVLALELYFTVFVLYQYRKASSKDDGDECAACNEKVVDDVCMSEACRGHVARTLMASMQAGIQIVVTSSDIDLREA